MTTIHSLQVNALFLDKPEQVIGQDIRFENIPWMNTEKGVFENPNTPLETNSIIPRPFSYDNAIYLKEGVHLHFVLPTHFKKFDEHGNLPAAPNRWYIKNERSGKEWIVESDYIWNINDPDLDKHATCTYVEGEAGKDFNFHYVGRKYSLGDWQKRPEHTNYLKEFTAIGWGSLSFDIHYPNCRSIFGFHDEEGKPKDIYTIVGWVNDSNNNIVANKFKIEQKSTSDSSLISENYKVSIANTLPEALTALILEDVQEDTSKPLNLTEKLTEEERIEAFLNFDSLNDEKLDLITRLRHNLHEKQFRKVQGTKKWRFKTLNINGEFEQICEIIYKKYEGDLIDLNKFQKKSDELSFKLYSDLQSIHIDWSNYLQELFVDKIHTQNINADFSALQNKFDQISANERILDNYLYRIEHLKTKIETDIKLLKDCELEGLIKHNKLNDILAVNDELKLIICEIGLESYSELDFEQTTPPSVIISQKKREKKNKTRYNVGCITDFKFDHKLLLESIEILFGYNFIIDEPISVNNICSAVYKVAWHAQFLPKKLGHYLDNNNIYAESYIQDAYQLDEQNADLIKHFDNAEIAYSNKENNYFGEAFIDNNIVDFIKDKLDKIEGRLDDCRVLKDYKKKLDDIDVLSITLSDFNNLMVQRSTALSVLPFIPNGYKNHKDFAKSLNVLLSKHKYNINLYTPNRLSQFNPLRNGALRIHSLRIINNFGKWQDLMPSKTITTKQQTVKSSRNWVNLPPRLLQPTALQTKICNTKTTIQNIKDDNAIEINNPVIGYILPSFLNQHLQFFNALGEYLGDINEEGNWEPNPFDYSKAKDGKNSYKKCGNDDLVKTISWFLKHSKGNPEFRSQIIREFQTNLEHIQPENYQNPSLLETITSVPLAITKMSYKLFTKGDILYNVAECKSFKQDHSDYCNKLDAIKFPIRFGDINQYNDGLIGYWHDNMETLYINSETVREFTDELKIVKYLDELKKLINESKDDQLSKVKDRFKIFSKTENTNSSAEKNEIPVSSRNFDEFYRSKCEDINEFREYQNKKDKYERYYKIVVSEGKNPFDISDYIYKIEDITKRYFVNYYIVRKEFDLDLPHKPNQPNETPKPVTPINPLFPEIIKRVLGELNKIDISNLNINIINVELLKEMTLGNIDLKSIFSENMQPIIEQIKDLSQQDIGENAFNFLIEILDKKGQITKADVLKHFIEDGNKIWSILQKIGLIIPDVSNKVTVIASKNMDNNNFVQLNKEQKSIYALMHPKAKLFFKTGILPEKHIMLPYNEIKEALRKIELTLLTSPVLTPKDDLQISLLQDGRYKWSWIELKKNIIEGNEVVRDTNRITQDSAIKLENAKALLTDLVDTDLGDYYPTENIYFVKEDKYNELLNKADKSEEESKKLELIQDNLTPKVRTFNTSNSAIPTLVLKEGWLSLKPTKI